MRQVHVVLFRSALGPFLQLVIISQIVPCVATVVVLEAPARIVCLALDFGLLGATVAVAGALSRRGTSLSAGRCRHGGNNVQWLWEGKSNSLVSPRHLYKRYRLCICNGEAVQLLSWLRLGHFVVMNEYDEMSPCLRLGSGSHVGHLEFGPPPGSWQAVASESGVCSIKITDFALRLEFVNCLGRLHWP